MMAEEELPSQDVAAQLEAARGEIAGLRSAASEAASDVTALRSALADANARYDAAAEDASALRLEAEAASARERDAAARYRDLMLRAEPALPVEMIAGDTLDAIDASVVAAREIVTRVRSHIDAQSTGSRVPAGSPQRAAADVSGMSPQQKIRYGLEQRTNTG